VRLEPKHKWVEVDISQKKIESNKEKSFVILPEDYSPSQSPYKDVAVVTDPYEEYAPGTRIVVPTHIIRDIEIDGFKFNFIERSHIMAVIHLEPAQIIYTNKESF